MSNEEKEIIESQLKSFTRFVLELEVEKYLQQATEAEVMKGIAEATKRYKDDLEIQIHNSLIRLGLAEMVPFFNIGVGEVMANLNASQKLVNQFVKQEFGGI